MKQTSPEYAEDDDADTQAGVGSLSGQMATGAVACDSGLHLAGGEPDKPVNDNFDAIVSAHESAMLRYARYQLGRDYEGRHHDAQDIVQEALLRLHRQWSQDKHGGLKNVRAWLMRVTHNLTIDAIRKRGRQRAAKIKMQQDALDTTSRSSTESNGMDALETNEAAGHAMRLLRELPDTQQRVMMLRLNELTVREIAEVLGMSVGNVGYHMNQALTTIARQMKQAGAV